MSSTYPKAILIAVTALTLGLVIGFYASKNIVEQNKQNEIAAAVATYAANPLNQIPPLTSLTGVVKSVGKESFDMDVSHVLGIEVHPAFRSRTVQFSADTVFKEMKSVESASSTPSSPQFDVTESVVKATAIKVGSTVTAVSATEIQNAYLFMATEVQLQSFPQ